MPKDRQIKLKLYDIVEKDPKYSKDAYLFCLQVVKKTLQSQPLRGHVRGAVIVEVLYSEARNQFGPLAKTVLEHWGIHSPRCIGDIIFRLVEEGILNKSSQDSIQDFEASPSMDMIFNPEKEYILRMHKTK